ncbi:MAG: hypothetical protein ABWY16_15945 [Pedobacter sp.]|jgi:hypothetical protein|uniref:hypothetical protein n=1 Tax=Pedobacter sp. TaxID=1411316 RepID=UPI003396F1A5
MQLYSYRLSIFIFFMTIFALKMVVSAVPVFLCHDNYSYKSIVLDLEEEHDSQGDVKDMLKCTDCRTTDFHYGDVYIPSIQEIGIKNCFIDHSKRYVNHYYSSVPTPPPNYAVIQTL